MPTPCCRMPCSSPPALAGRRLSRSGGRHRSPSSIGRRRPTMSFGRSATATGIRTAKAKSLYDQQPVEAVTMADAALAAFRLARATRNTWRLSAGHTTGSTARTACEQPLADVRVRRLLRRPAAARREPQPGSGIDARLSVDGSAQLGNPASLLNDTLEAAAAQLDPDRIHESTHPAWRRKSECCENRKRRTCTRNCSIAIRANPILTAAGLALSGPHGVQRRRLPGGR